MKGLEPCWGVEVDLRGPGSLLTSGQLQQAFLLLQPVIRHLLKPDRLIASSTPGPQRPFGPARHGEGPGFYHDSPHGSLLTTLLTRF